MSKNPSQALETQKTASTVATSAYQTASQTVAPKPLDQNKVLEQIASKMPHLKEDPTKFREELVQLASPKKAAPRTSQTASQNTAPKPLDQNKVLEQIASKMPHLKKDPTKFREELVQLASPKKAATRTSQAASQNTAPKSETPSPSPKTDPSSTKPLDSTISQGMTGTRV